MARATDPTAHRLVWRGRLYHRLLRLARLADRNGADRAAAIDGGLAVLALGSAIMAMRDMLKKGDLPAGVRRSLDTALARLERVGKAPDKAAAALSTASERLSRLGAPEGETLASASRALAANAAFLREAR
ncbi:FUSC family protein [Ancylobacter sp. VNQ12]|uniref:FUSC family protein n=1 Tax=Ancylobacter sp. VNQ12 TaxID=3400920 RepID=UPI003C035FD4